MEKEKLLSIIEKLNNQVAQLNLDNIILRAELEMLTKEKEEE